MVGDALMAPYELLARQRPAYLGEDDGRPGMCWLMQLARHFERSVLAQPRAAELLARQHHRDVRQVFEMFPLTLEGLGEAVAHLIKGKRGRRAA